MNVLSRSVLFLLLFAICSSLTSAADWPMWRYDAERRAASPEQLPDLIELQWTLDLPQREQVWDDPLNHDLMPYDRVFEPIVLGERIFLTFNDSDKVVAYHTSDGSESWRFYTDGPVRLPPVGHEGNIYVTSDDGFLYCLTADSGKLKWKFRGGPGPLKVLGNKRLVSAWPARGGPVIRDGQVYFAASIWPMMGTFIYSLDAETGAVEWMNDSTGSQYIKQPHSAPSFAGVAPQGALVAMDELLIVPGGRSVPAAFDRSTGKFRHFEINDGGKGNGGSFVIANGEEYFVHTRYRGVRNYDLASGRKRSYTCNEPVLTNPYLYTASDEKGKKEVHIVDDEKKKRIWTVAADGTGDLIKAGDELFAAGENSVTAIRLSDKGSKGKTIWTRKVNGNIQRLLAGNGMLFAVTLDGNILAFGPSNASSRIIAPTEKKPDVTKGNQATDLLKQTKAHDGYCLWYGADDVTLLESAVLKSELRIVVVDPNKDKVEQLRRHFDDRGFYGKRITIHEGTPESFSVPPYIAHLVQVSPSVAQKLTPTSLESLYNSVRPYGGALSLPSDPKIQTILKEADLQKAEFAAEKTGSGQEPNRVGSGTQQTTVVFRSGALPDSADWTHQYGDIANSVKSDDSRLKLPLGVLWFGGSSNMDVLPRHGHGPPEQVIGGRMFIEGIDCISARDVYTGRVLWIRRFEDLGTFGIYYNETYKNTPLDPSYNQKHIPGANGRGTNYVATEDAVYVAIADSCHILDPKTGKTRKTIQLTKQEGQNEAPYWGFIGVYEDVLIGGNGFANYSQKFSPKDEPAKPTIEDYSASDGLVGFDRHSGKKLWKIPAKHSFLHNGIVAGGGRIHCLDKLPASAQAKIQRRGERAPNDYRIVTIDCHTGKILWENKQEIFGTWLGYSTEHDILLLAGAKASDRLKDEVSQGMKTYRGESGEILWHRKEVRYSGPCILHNELIIANADQHSNRKGIGETSTVFSLLDGSDQMIRNPITGAEEPWRIARGKGCNTMIACENFLTFRDGSASYYDLESKDGIGSFGGFKSGCTANLVVANGVLNAPDYTRTCSCSYQNQTSLALIHMPEVELWTSSLLGGLGDGAESIRQLGINFGAPGDRRSDEGTMWLDYPSVGGRSPGFEVEVVGDDVEYFRQHASAISGSDLPWIAASGVQNAEAIIIRPKIASEENPDTDPGTYIAEGKSNTAEESVKGKVTISSSDLEMTQESSTQTIGIRFEKVDLKPGDAVPPAFLQFTVDEVGEKPTQLTIHAEASDSAREFKDDSRNISERARSKASLSWSPAPWKKTGESGAAQKSPDLASLISEVISRPGWKPGNSIAFLISGEGKRVASSSKNPPKLVVEEAQNPEPNAPEEAVSKKRYSVLLHFSEPNGLQTGERVFDVALQGATVLENFDIRAAVEPNQSLIKRFENVRIGDALQIDLRSIAGGENGPVISGVELIAE